MAKKAGLGRGLDALFADAAPVDEKWRPEEAGEEGKSSKAADNAERSPMLNG